jgi:hypothetical protein
MSETLDELLERVGANKPKEEIAVTPVAEEVKSKVVSAETAKSEEPTEVDENAEPKSFIDKLKEVSEAKVETPKEEVKPEVAAAELLAEIESYKAKLANYESDPLHKAVDMGATREELLAIAAELKSKDYSKSSYSDLIAAEIARETGLEGDELVESIEQAIYEYESLPKYKQVLEEKKLKAKFESEAKLGESPTLKAIEAAYEEKNKGFKTPEAIKEERETIAQQETEAIKSVGKGLVGAVLHGVEFTEAMLNEIVTKDYHIDKVADFVDEKGNLDIGGFIQTKFITKNLEAMIQWAKEEGKREANQGSGVTKVVRKGSTTIVQSDPNKQALKDLGMPDYIVDAPKVRILTD